MKQIGKIILFLLCIMLPLTGCSSAPSSEPAQTYVAPVPPFTVQDNTIRIVSLPLSLFETILQDPDTSALATNVCQESVFSALEETDLFITANNIPFHIEKFLPEFWGNADSINEYLQNNGIHEAVEECVFLDVFRAPTTAWIKTASSHLFVTIDPQYNYEGDVLKITYDYTLYSQEEYAREFRCLDAKLLVDGKEVCGNNKNALYHDSSVIPLLPTLKAMGVSVTNIGFSTVLGYDGTWLLMNRNTLSLYRFNDFSRDLLELQGGAGGLYIVDNEIICDDFIVRTVFMELGGEATVMRDRESQTITITTS